MAYEIAFPAAVINKIELSTDRRYLPDPCFISPDRRALFFCVIPRARGRSQRESQVYVCLRVYVDARVCQRIFPRACPRIEGTVIRYPKRHPRVRLICAI